MAEIAITNSLLERYCLIKTMIKCVSIAGKPTRHLLFKLREIIVDYDRVLLHKYMGNETSKMVTDIIRELDILTKRIMKLCISYRTRYNKRNNDKDADGPPLIKLLRKVREHKLVGVRKLTQVNQVRRDLCECGGKMSISREGGELFCTICKNVIKYTHQPDNNNHNTNSSKADSNKSAHKTDRILSSLGHIQKSTINDKTIKRIRNTLISAGIKYGCEVNTSNTRAALCKLKLTKYNDNVPYIMCKVTKSKWVDVSPDGMQKIITAIRTCVAIHTLLYPKDNFIYAPFIIERLAEIFLSREECVMIKKHIHRQSIRTEELKWKKWNNIRRYLFKQKTEQVSQKQISANNISLVMQL